MHFPDPHRWLVCQLGLKRDLISREQVSTKLGIIVFICAPLLRRAIQLSPLTLTLAMFSTPYHHWKGLRFYKGVCVWHPTPWASHPGVLLVEPPFLEGSRLPSLVPSPLCSLNSVLFWPISPTIPDEMIQAAAVITVFLVLLCILHSSSEVYQPVIELSLIQNIIMIAKDKLSSSLSSSSGLRTTKQHCLYMVTKLTWACL